MPMFVALVECSSLLSAALLASMWLPDEAAASASLLLAVALFSSSHLTTSSPLSVASDIVTRFGRACGYRSETIYLVVK
ncbi:hypothetical protein DER45DRAFT_552907 [Fusarium avenaceum]|nr:hypothetical protein DER45DRAFT_552907 [Fusarium avenaceum]